MGDVMFDIPSSDNVAKCIIDKNCILDGAEPKLLTHKDVKKIESSDELLA